MRHAEFITKCEINFLQTVSDITKFDKSLLRSVTTICNKMRLVLESVTILTKCDSATFLNDKLLSKQNKQNIFHEGTAHSVANIS